MGPRSIAKLVLLASMMLATSQSRAQIVIDGPSKVEHYRFLPRRSVLHETGGIYPHDTAFRVFGTFDFVTSPGFTDNWPGNNAEFDNVKAWASHPILAYVLPLNQVLNLEGLKGVQLPVAGPFDAYRFDGETKDGSSVALYATIIGPWFHLSGGTTPPPNSADMFVYNIRATARLVPFADFNASESVDGSDLAKWSSGFGSTVPAVGDTSPFGDANEDQVVDGSDFLSWQRQLGQTAPGDAVFEAVISAALASETASNNAVPEPGALLLAVGGFAVLVARRRR